jgi:hypothetical protein
MSSKSFRVLVVFQPIDGIGFDLKTNAVMLGLVSDDVFIIITLPNVGNDALLMNNFAHHGGFILSDDRTQRSRNGLAEIFDVVRRGTPWRAPG